MKYKRLVDDDGIYNEEGKLLHDEYLDLIKPFIEKYMLLLYDSSDLECMITRTVALPMTELMVKRKLGISPFFTKKNKER